MATDEETRAAQDSKLDALHERLTGAVEQLVSGSAGVDGVAEVPQTHSPVIVCLRVTPSY